MPIVRTKYSLCPEERLTWFKWNNGVRPYDQAKHVHRTTPGCVCVSRETSANGGRTFGVLYNPEQLRGPVKNSHVYEVVLPGTARFFIDFDWYVDPTHDDYDENFPPSEEAYATLMEAITEALRAQGATDFSHTVLESTGDYKYSRHVMFDNVWFQSITPHMKCFADDLAASWADSDNYVLRKASEDHKTVFDQNVYSTMRNWRMPFQSKINSDRVLLPVNDGTWKQFHPSRMYSSSESSRSWLTSR